MDYWLSNMALLIKHTKLIINQHNWGASPCFFFAPGQAGGANLSWIANEKKSPCRNDSHQQSQHIVLDRLKSPTQSMWGWYGSIWGLQEFRTAPFVWSHIVEVTSLLSLRRFLGPASRCFPAAMALTRSWIQQRSRLRACDGPWKEIWMDDIYLLATSFHSISCILLIFLKFSNLLVLGPRTSTHLQAIRTKSVLISTLEAILEDDSYLFHLFISS